MAFTLGGGARVITVTGGTGTVTVNAWEIARIRWVSATPALADECKITDTAGNVIFDSFAESTEPFVDELELGKVTTFLGIKVVTLASGTIYFYLR